jgi:hypothetical protein
MRADHCGSEGVGRGVHCCSTGEGVCMGVDDCIRGGEVGMSGVGSMVRSCSSARVRLLDEGISMRAVHCGVDCSISGEKVGMGVDKFVHGGEVGLSGVGGSGIGCVVVGERGWSSGGSEGDLSYVGGGREGVWSIVCGLDA